MCVCVYIEWRGCAIYVHRKQWADVLILLLSVVRLKSIDIEFMKRLHEKVRLVMTMFTDAHMPQSVVMMCFNWNSYAGEHYSCHSQGRHADTRRMYKVQEDGKGEKE